MMFWRSQRLARCFTTLAFLVHATTSSSSSIDNANAPDAIIIGAGPVGLATALALSPVCHKVYLVEKSTSFTRQGAIIGVDLCQQDILKNLDSELYETVKQRAMIVGSVLVGNPWLCLWSELRDALVDSVRRRSYYKGGNIQFCMGRECIDIQQHMDGRIVVRCRNAGLPLIGDVVVGADGSQSRVRQILGLPTGSFWTPSSNTTIFQGSLYVTSNASPQLWAFLDDKKIIPMKLELDTGICFLVFNFHKCLPRKLAWVLMTNNVLEESITVQQVLHDHVQDPTMRQWMEEIINHSDARSWKPYTRPSLVSQNEYHNEYEVRKGRGQITLLGDAAGLRRVKNGWSLGLDDVICLSRSLKGPGTLSQRLSHFEQERISQVQPTPDDKLVNQNENRRKLGNHFGFSDTDFLHWFEMTA